MYASPFFCLLAFAREIKKLCIVLYVAGGFRIKLSVSFVFKLERLSSDFVFTFSKLLNINYFHTCEVLFLKGRKLRSRECAFRDNNTHSVSGSNRWQAVGITVSDLTDPRFEPEVSRDERVTGSILSSI